MRMKRLALMVISLFLVGVLAACGGKDTIEEEKVSLEEIYTDIKDEMAKDLKEGGVEEPLVDGKLQSYLELDLTKSDPENEFFIERLQLDKEQLEAGYVIAALMNVNADEMILLKAKDEESVPALKEILENELKNQVQTWEQYLPEQYEKVKNNMIKTNGQYLIYITYDQPEKIAELFNLATK